MFSINFSNNKQIKYILVHITCTLLYRIQNTLLNKKNNYKSCITYISTDYGN